MGRRKRVEMRPTLLKMRTYTMRTNRDRGFPIEATDIAGACQEFEQRVKDGRIVLEPGEERALIESSFL